MKMYLFTDGEMTNNKHLSDVSEQISQVKKDNPICKTIKKYSIITATLLRMDIEKVCSF